MPEAKELVDFDSDALREKYRSERDKRLRVDGNDQYRNITGDLVEYLEDPYVEPGFTRDALTDEVQVAVIGGGFGGLLAGAELRKAGIKFLARSKRVASSWATGPGTDNRVLLWTL